MPWAAASELRELTGLDQVDQEIPLVLLEDGEIARLADPDFISDNLDIRAGATTRRAERDLVICHSVHLPPFTTLRCSMQGHTAAGRCRRDRQDRPAAI